LLEGHPDLDELLVVRLKQWRKAPLSPVVLGQAKTFLNRLRAFKATIALALMGNHKGGVLARASGADRSLGAAKAQRREPSSALWLGETLATPGVHAVDRALGLLAGLGIAPEAADFAGDKIMPDSVPPGQAAEKLGQSDQPYVVMQVGAGWGNKCYPPHWWAEVARRLRQATGLLTQVPIAPGEEDMARQVAGASGGSAHTVEARSLPLLAQLLRSSRLVMGGDTGPIHLAHAMGTPVLSLIGPTDPARNGPYGSPEMVIWRRLPCSFCYKRMSEAKACLLSISPGEVAERAIALLA
jgi:heptosyltransferase-1